MDPLTIGLIGLGISAVGTGLSAYGTISSAQAQKEAHEEASTMYAAEAVAKKEKSEYEEKLHREKIQRIIGTQKVLYGKAGVDITEGSPFLTMMQTEIEGEKEAELIRKGGEIEAGKSWGESKLQSMYAKAAGRAGTIGGISTFFTGLGQAGLQYGAYRKGIA